MSLDRVVGDSELYIGSLFSMRAKEALKNANITHVVSALRSPLNKKLFEGYEHLHIEVDDVEDENMLEWFPVANDFVRGGLEGGGGVLVHCVMGKSRSATLILAHLLSASFHQPSQQPPLTPFTALSHLRLSHPLAEPNPGFMSQLALYHHMRCPLSLSTHPLYLRWLNERIAGESAAVGVGPGEGAVRYRDESVRKGEGEDGNRGEKTFRCRRCRTALATSAYLVPHSPPSSSSPSTNPSPYAPISSRPPQRQTPTQQCSHLFLDPLSWMRPELEQGKLEGRLECPKCRQNVGKYAWQGMRCSCGGWVVPGVSLGRGRVDEIVGVKGMGERKL